MCEKEDWMKSLGDETLVKDSKSRSSDGESMREEYRMRKPGEV